MRCNSRIRLNMESLQIIFLPSDKVRDKNDDTEDEETCPAQIGN